MTVKKTEFLVKGFSEGFSIDYKGPMNRKDKSRNIPFTVGNKYQMWSHMMKEVELKHFTGPYKEIPFETFVQSPIGLYQRQEVKHA